MPINRLTIVVSVIERGYRGSRVYLSPPSVEFNVYINYLMSKLVNFGIT